MSGTIFDRVLRNATAEERRDIKEMLALIKQQPRKKDFEPFIEPFRPVNIDEVKSLVRQVGVSMHISDAAKSEILVSYRAILGGFTICNILVNNRLYSGCSHCIKSDCWLPVRGKMIAFRRALQSEGIELPTAGESKANG